LELSDFYEMKFEREAPDCAWMTSIHEKEFGNSNLCVFLLYFKNLICIDLNFDFG
jgi:hypothetical protein